MVLGVCILLTLLTACAPTGTSVGSSSVPETVSSVPVTSSDAMIGLRADGSLVTYCIQNEFSTDYEFINTSHHALALVPVLNMIRTSEHQLIPIYRHEEEQPSGEYPVCDPEAVMLYPCAEGIAQLMPTGKLKITPHS